MAITEKSTKAEIMAAYRELAGQPNQPPLPGAPTVQAHDDPAGVIGETKTRVIESLNQAIELVNELNEEHRKAKTNFEQLLSRQRAAWEHERKERAAALEHEEALRQIKRQQEDAQYGFERSQRWQKEEAALRANLGEREEALAARQKALADSEEELRSLRARVANVPKELEAVAAQARDELKATLTKQFDQDRKLTTQQMESDRKLAQQRIATLEATSSQQQGEIDSLTKQLATAQAQLKEIAIKVIEGPRQQKSPEESGIIRPNGDRAIKAIK